MRPVNSKGQALAEFIIVIPLFLVLMLGVIQFSLLFFAYQMVHYASFAAARAAIVRPCAAFHPDDSEVEHFTPAVFTAAALVTTVAMPPQCLVNPGQNTCVYEDLDSALQFLPSLRPTSQVDGLGFNGEQSGSRPLAVTKYINAAYLTSVQRVYHSNLGSTPIVWTPYPEENVPGIPCDVPDEDQGQNVPAPGSDLSLEVTLVYPMTVPLVNRVAFGIFVNFSSLAERLGLSQIVGPSGGPDDVMVYPLRTLADVDQDDQVRDVLADIFMEFGYSGASLGKLDNIRTEFDAMGWYPIPIRARCTLTTEGAIYPLTGPPTRQAW